MVSYSESCSDERGERSLLRGEISRGISTSFHPSTNSVVIAVHETNLLSSDLISAAIQAAPPDARIVLVANSSTSLGDCVMGALMRHGEGGNRVLVTGAHGLDRLKRTHLVDEDGQGLVARFSWTVREDLPEVGPRDGAQSDAIFKVVLDRAQSTSTGEERYREPAQLPAVKVLSLASFERSDDLVVVTLKQNICGDNAREAFGELLRDETLLPYNSRCLLDLSVIVEMNSALFGEVLSACRIRLREGAQYPLGLKLAAGYLGFFKPSLGARLGYEVVDR